MFKKTNTTDKYRVFFYIKCIIFVSGKNTVSVFVSLCVSVCLSVCVSVTVSLCLCVKSCIKKIMDRFG